MNGRAFYNEIDPYAAAWLRNLIAAGHIAPGEVNERSIVDLRPSDLNGFTQCHFFAGIGVWSYALRLAGWPDDRPVWTGSCPCQPFSAAGKGGGFSDERHLWPAFFHLIGECRPAVVLGEQVASRDGLDWLDLVQDDMEGTGYAFGAVDTSSALHGAPHIRQRLRWVAYATSGRGRTGFRDLRPAEHGLAEPANGGAVHFLGNPGAAGLSPREREAVFGTGRREEGRTTQQSGGASGGLAYADGWNLSNRDLQPSREHEQQPQDGLPVRRGDPGFGHNGGPELDRPGPTNGFWRDPDWLFCRDGRWRPVEPGTFPLAHGLPRGMATMQPELRGLAKVAGLHGKSLARAKAHRIGTLKGAGNAVDAEATAAFIRCLP